MKEWLDVDIHAYASINFQGFIDLTDLAGGIEVYVPRNMNYDDPDDGTHINLKKGQQVLDGKNALDFVRFRKSNDGRHDSDYDRMKRQQQALAVLSDELASFRFINRAYRAMDILGANVKTSLTAEETNQLIRQFHSLDLQDIESTSMQGGGFYTDGVWYEKIPEKELERIEGVIKDFLDE